MESLLHRQSAYSRTPGRRRNTTRRVTVETRSPQVFAGPDNTPCDAGRTQRRREYLQTRRCHPLSLEKRNRMLNKQGMEIVRLIRQTPHYREEYHQFRQDHPNRESFDYEYFKVFVVDVYRHKTLAEREALGEDYKRDMQALVHHLQYDLEDEEKEEEKKEVKCEKARQYLRRCYRR